MQIIVMVTCCMYYCYFFLTENPNSQLINYIFLKKVNKAVWLCDQANEVIGCRASHHLLGALLKPNLQCISLIPMMKVFLLLAC